MTVPCRPSRLPDGGRLILREAPEEDFASIQRLRGGGWNNSAENLRSAIRNRNHARNRNDNVGFRVAVAPPNTPNPRRAGASRVCSPERAEPPSPPVLVGRSTERPGGPLIEGPP